MNKASIGGQKVYPAPNLAVGGGAAVPSALPASAAYVCCRNTYIYCWFVAGEKVRFNAGTRYSSPAGSAT